MSEHPEKRAVVQGSYHGHPRNRTGAKGEGPGTIAWAEHELAWLDYARRYGNEQSAQRMHDRGGFSYAELVDHLGREPETWLPHGAEGER